jgi:hypothetical protein
MSNIAYTIGRTTAYDQAVIEGGVKKLGRREINPTDPNEPPYEGGWVWRRWGDAENFRANLMSIEIPGWASMDFSVYQLELPTSWEDDVTPEPICKGKTASGAHFLLHDSRIVRAVYADPEAPEMPAAEALLISANTLADTVQEIVRVLEHQGYGLSLKQVALLKRDSSNYQALREFHRTK